jgi:glycosyltransferase involved in cell wall biosynthesis
MNTFTIVTVVKDDLSGLKKSRFSLETQTSKDWKHIIIDGNSKDGTADFGKSLPGENTIFISENDSGIYDAMNKGYKLADPESFVFFLNAQDIFASEISLTEAYKAMTNFPEANWGCTTHEEIQENGEGWVCKLVAPPNIHNQLYAFGYRSHQAVIMKAKFIDRLGGFDSRYRIASDWELISKALLEEEPVEWKFPLSIFQLGGLSSSQALKAHLELKEIRRRYLIKTPTDRIFDEIWCGIYLRQFGYRNFFTKFLDLAFPTRLRLDKVQRQKSNFEMQRRFVKFKIWIRKGIRLLGITRRKFKSSFSFSPHKHLGRLHRRLKILNYRMPIEKKNST